MALHDYLAGEVGEDWADGVLSRREAIRRLLLLGLSVSSAVALLESCAPGRERERDLGCQCERQRVREPAASSGEADRARSDGGARGSAVDVPGPTAALGASLSAAASSSQPVGSDHVHG